MQKIEVDVAVLGAGTGGLVARRAAEKAGASTLLIDPGPLGTTCARVGCMPSKLLIAAAEAAHHARHAGVFGIEAAVKVNGPKVMKRVREQRDYFVSFVLDSVEALEQKERLIVGWGALIDAHTIEIDGHTQVKAGSIVIATGSSPFVPPPFRNLSRDVLVFNDDVFEWEDLPESVLVVGTGVIAMELGQALHRLGVRTTVVGIDGLVGPLTDPKMLEAARRIFGAELDLHCDYALQHLEESDEGVSVRFEDPDGSVVESQYQYVLMAAGRTPNVRDIGLEHVGVELDPRGMPPWDPHTAQVGDSHVFLAGDVSGYRPLLHEAADEGRIAGANAARYPQVLRKPRTTPIAVVFTDPQMAIVGQPWQKMDCHQYRVGEIDYRKQGRARVMNANKGLVRLYGDVERGLLVGAQMLGPRVEHTAHLLAWAIEQRLTVRQLLAMPFYHPVIEEGIRTALRDLESQLQFSRPPGVPCEDFGPGD